MLGVVAGRLGLTLTEYRALEAGDLLLTNDRYEQIVELGGWPRGKGPMADDPESSASMNFAAGRNVTHP